MFNIRRMALGRCYYPLVNIQKKNYVKSPGSVRRKWIHYFTVIIIVFSLVGGGGIFLCFFSKHLNEFEDTRMNWGSAFFWGGRLTNELEDIRMNWGSDFFLGRKHTNELEGIRMNSG